MRSLLPWISYTRKDHIFWQKQSQPTQSKLVLPPSESKPFQLKQLNKHVSQYQRYEQTQEIHTRDTHTSAGHIYRKNNSNNLLLRKGRIDKKEEIMEKAHQLNNKYYASLISKVNQKNQLINSVSLQRFDSSQKENVFVSYRKDKTKQSHKQTHFYTHLKSSSNTNLKDEIRQLKQSRPFRSKWFTDLQQLKSLE